MLASERFAADRYGILRSVIRNNCVRLVVQSVAAHPKLFSRRYLRALERHSLIRFSYQRKQGGTLLKRYRELHQRLSGETPHDSIFEAMGDLREPSVTSGSGRGNPPAMRRRGRAGR